MVKNIVKGKLLISLGMATTPIVTITSISCGSKSIEKKDISFDVKTEDMKVAFTGYEGGGSYKLNFPLNIENVILLHAIKKKGQMDFGPSFVSKPNNLANGDELKFIWKPLVNSMYNTINQKNEYTIIKTVEGLVKLNTSPLKGIELVDVKTKLQEIFKSDRDSLPSIYLKQNKNDSFLVDQTTFNIETMPNDVDGVIKVKIISAIKGNYMVKEIEFWEWNKILNFSGFQTNQDVLDINNQQIVDNIKKSQIEAGVDALFAENDNLNPLSTPSETLQSNSEYSFTINGANIIVTLIPKDINGTIEIVVKSITKENASLSQAKLDLLAGSIGGFLNSTNAAIRGDAIVAALNSITKDEIKEKIDTLSFDKTKRPSIIADMNLNNSYYSFLTIDKQSVRNGVEVTVQFIPNDVTGELSYNVISITKQNKVRESASLTILSNKYTGFLTIAQVFNKIDKNLIENSVKKDLNIATTNRDLPSNILKKLTNYEFVVFGAKVVYTPIPNDDNGEIIYTLNSISLGGENMHVPTLSNLASKITGLATKVEYWTDVIKQSYKSDSMSSALHNVIVPNILRQELLKILKVTDFNNITPTGLANAVITKETDFKLRFGVYGDINYKVKFDLIPLDSEGKIQIKIIELSTQNVQLPADELNKLNTIELQKQNWMGIKYGEITLDYIYVNFITTQEVKNLVNTKYQDNKQYMASTARFIIHGPTSSAGDVMFTAQNGTEISLAFTGNNDATGKLYYEIRSVKRGAFTLDISWDPYLDEELDGFKTPQAYKTSILEQIQNDVNNTEIKKAVENMIKIPNKTIAQTMVNELNLFPTEISFDKIMTFNHKNSAGVTIETMDVIYTIKGAIVLRGDNLNKEVNFVVSELKIEDPDSTKAATLSGLNIADKIIGFK